MFKQLKHFGKAFINALTNNKFTEGFNEDNDGKSKPGTGVDRLLDALTAGEHSRKKKEEQAIKDRMKQIEIDQKAQRRLAERNNNQQNP